jgi:type VI protein secretion system component VasK
MVYRIGEVMLIFLQGEAEAVLGSSIFFLFLALVIALLYFLPIIIAVNKNHPQTTAIALVTIFGGWSFVGWFIALIMAMSGQRGNRPKKFVRRRKSSRFRKF